MSDKESQVCSLCTSCGCLAIDLSKNYNGYYRSVFRGHWSDAASFLHISKIHHATDADVGKSMITLNCNGSSYVLVYCKNEDVKRALSTPLVFIEKKYINKVQGCKVIFSFRVRWTDVNKITINISREADENSYDDVTIVMPDRKGNPIVHSFTVDRVAPEGHLWVVVSDELKTTMKQQSKAAFK